MVQNFGLYLVEDLQWKELCDNLFEAIPSFSLYEYSVRGSLIAQLVGMLPFFAKTERPMRDGLSNLCIFILSYFTESRTLFRDGPMDDDIFDRFLGIMCFTEGNSAIIDRGMSLIGLSILNSYRNKAKADLTANIYNPLNSGLWDYSALVDDLTQRIKKNPCRKMDRILNLNSIHNVVWDW